MTNLLKAYKDDYDFLDVTQAVEMATDDASADEASSPEAADDALDAAPAAVENSSDDAL